MAPAGGVARRRAELWGMSRGEFIFVTGGARSGKSRFAQDLAAGDAGPVVYVATGLATDPEMAERIAAHRRERPAAWRTVEAPREVAAVLAAAGHNQDGGTVLVDCLGFLVANWLNELWPGKNGPAADGDGPREPDRVAAVAAVAEIDGQVRHLARLARECPARVIIVSNEVGWGIVPAYPAGRLFRDLLGRANQAMAAAADRVYLVVSGLAVEIKASGLGRAVGNGTPAVGREEGDGGG